jgi:phage repressor protein C with HTH and peptisase S24 domain
VVTPGNTVQGDEGLIWLLSENELYPPIEITEGMDFEVWGRVVYSILGH